MVFINKLIMVKSISPSVYFKNKITCIDIIEIKSFLKIIKVNFKSYIQYPGGHLILAKPLRTFYNLIHTTN